MRPRIARELELLRNIWPNIQHAEAAGADWFKIPNYVFPSGWLLNGSPIEAAPILFTASAAYPTGDPYAFWAPAALTFGTVAPTNTTPTGNDAFSGSWLQFSWSPDGDWRPKDVVEEGSNLCHWARSFHKRLREGI